MILLAFAFFACQTGVNITLLDPPVSQESTTHQQSSPTQGYQERDGLAAHDGPKRATDLSGTVTIQYENDTFADRSDNNFTAGFGTAWTSAAVQTMDEDNWFRRMVSGMDFLPTVGKPSYVQHLQLALDYEMYTAQDTSVADPPPGSHPYSGIIELDTAVFSMSKDDSHGYWLRIGLVGPATHAEELQNGMHEATGRPLAMGWDTQLRNEIFVNLFYVYQRRLLRYTASPTGFGYDATVNGGVGFGTYYTGVNAGGQLRLGFGLPGNFDRSYTLNLYEELPGRRLQGGPLSIYVHFQFTGTAVGRFLPIDGNTWVSSRSGIRDDFYAQLNLGATISYGRLLLTYRTNLAGSGLQQEQNDDDFSTVTISYVFQ